MKVAVLGAGAAGLASSLSLARRGHDVVLIERDRLVSTDGWERALEAKRSIPQYVLPHGFLARARKVLFENARDVYDDLVRAGAVEIDVCGRLPEPDRDPDLRALGTRRALIEWALTRAVVRESRIDVRDATRVLGLQQRTGAVDGVVTDQGPVSADLVVDATGRTSKLPAWLAELGGPPIPQTSTDCGSLGYSRYFRLLPTAAIPPILAPISATGDTGYMSFGIFWEDNGVFAVVLTTPAWDRELRALRASAAHMACARAMPPLRSFVDPATSEPVTGVFSMGRLRNVHRRWVTDDRPAAIGVLPIGDALCHTNSNYAYGLSLAFDQAFTLPDLVEDADGLHDLALRFDEAVGPELAERYRFASQVDHARLRSWRGKSPDLSTPSANLPLFMFRALPIAGVADPAIFRKAMRLIHLLDGVAVVAEDDELLSRAAGLYQERTATRRAWPFPTRDELLAGLDAAVKAS